MVNVIDYDRVRVTRRRLGTKEVFPDPLPDPYKTAAQMEQNCCEPTPALQCYEKHVGDIQPDMEAAMKNAGITPQVAGDYNGVGFKNGRLTRIAWKPRKNPCGKIIERAEMTPKNCCDGVEPMAVDTSVSATVITPGTFGFITITGGKLPFFIKLRGNGFSIDGYSLRDAWSFSRTFRVYAHEMACGHAPITIDDGCSILQTGIRASAGEWVTVVHPSNWPMDYCPFTGSHPEDQVGSGDIYQYKWEAYSSDNRHKLVQSSNIRLWDTCQAEDQAIRQSCIDGFWSVEDDVQEIINDACARSSNIYHGYYIAQHSKQLYEWRC